MRTTSKNPDWLYNADIGGLDCPGVTLTVRGVEETMLPNGVEKLGIRFRYNRPTSTPGKKIQESKLLVLNAGNTATMQDIAGSVPEQWVGRKVVLYVVPDTGHGFGPGIRIRAAAEDAQGLTLTTIDPARRQTHATDAKYSILPDILRLRDELADNGDNNAAAAAQDLAEAMIGMPDAGERRAIQDERGGTAQPAAAPAPAAPTAAPEDEMPF